MSKNHKKTTSKYSNPDEAPITYGESTNVSEEVETSEKIIDNPEVIATEETPVKEEIQKTEEESVKHTETRNEEPKVVQRAESEIPETAFTNFVKVRIVGIHRLSGYRMMSPVGIANLVVENSSGSYSVITSSTTTQLICRIIRECKGKLRMSNLSEERREQLISRYLNDLKKYKF